MEVSDTVALPAVGSCVAGKGHQPILLSWLLVVQDASLNSGTGRTESQYLPVVCTVVLI